MRIAIMLVGYSLDYDFCEEANADFKSMVILI